MIKNYFKIAWRGLWKQRFYAVLNIAGLAIGIAVSLILILYVQRELSFDEFHENAENIFRVGVEVEYDGVNEKWAKVPNSAGPRFKEEIKEVKEQVRFLRHNFGKKAFLRIANENFVEDDLYWVDSTVFKVFDLPLISGDASTALNGPNKVIISESVANKIFDKTNPVGQRIKVDNQIDLEITGVYPDFPSNSTLDCDIMGSFRTLRWASENLTWSNASFETFLLTQASATPASLTHSANLVLDKSVEKDNQWYSFWMQPMLDIHLHSKGIAENGYSARLGDATQIRVMSILALAILLLACFNYINMATARSQQRFREVGINKTLGATNGQMIRRFLVETGILVVIALFVSMLIINIVSPLVATLTGQSLDMSAFLKVEWLFGLTGLVLGLTFLAGLYPALFLSNFSPKKLLSPMQAGRSGNRFFRQFLVVGQFVVCIALIVGVIVFNNQLQFISNKNLGFKSDQVVAVNTYAASELSQIEGLMNAYRSMSEVESMGRVQGYPGISVSGYSMHKTGDESVYTGVSANHVDEGFDEVLGLKYIAGKTLPAKAPGDTTIQVVMNETAVKFLGWSPEEAIGKTPPGLFQDDTQIVGVVEDFHYESFHNPIGAYVFNNGNGMGRRPYLLVKLKTAEFGNTLQKLERTFNKYLPHAAFEYDFLSDQTAKLYASEKRMSRIISAFTFLTILISCLGLFGLAAFTTERRIKEIGIRKILGASVSGIVGLLSKDFLKPVLVALLIATPLSYYFMNQWLQGFAYRVDLQWWVFIAAGGLAVSIAFITVSFQSMKAALQSPVDSISNE